jgi:endonuclease/exonuclease/phosphatase family metal-dependent hydrolase
MLLRLLTWNIHRCIGLDRRFDPERVLATLRHHDPDIVLLQEVDRGVPRSNKLFLDHLIAQEMGYEFHSWAQSHVLKVGSYGNATFSRHPLVKRRAIDLRRGWRKSRNCLYTRLSLPRRSNLHVFNWHLGLSASERMHQVQAVLNSNTLKDLPTSQAVILGGDTNDWRNLLFHGAGIGAQGFDAWSEHGKRKPLRTFPSPAPAGALDKFFWRGPLHEAHVHVSKLKVAKAASDHLPLLAEFRLGI